MRRISLNEVTDDMTLAKPIYQGTKLILQTGVAGIPKYKEKLNNVGIFSVYVNDPVSDDISVPDVVCEQTREKCKANLPVFAALSHSLLSLPLTHTGELRSD